MLQAARESRWLGGVRLPVLLAATLIAVTWLVHLSMISIGGIQHYDEFYTLERSLSFGQHHDWLTVYTGNEPNFRKPPLQYWMTGGLLEGGVNEIVALRLPSMLFALGCLVLAGRLATVMLPGKVWVTPAAVLLCSTSDEFWRYSTSGMLEIGTTFFTTLALTGSLLALRRPHYWYLVAVAIGLGALQKAPSAFALVVAFLMVLWLTSRWHDHGLRQVVRTIQFRFASLIAVGLTLVWPLTQFARRGGRVFDDAYSDQIIDRFSPSTEAAGRGLSEMYGLIIVDEPVLRGLGIVALFCLPWLLRRSDLLALALTYMVFVAAMYFAGGQVYTRYSVMFVPLLSASLAVGIFVVFRRSWLQALALAGIFAASPPPLKNADSLRINGRYSDQIGLLTETRDLGGPDELLVVCDWESDARFPPGAVSVYGSNGRPFEVIRNERRLDRFVESERSRGKLRGICTRQQLDQVGDRLGEIVVVRESEDYVLWTSKGRAPARQPGN
jgi:4-amino-4-deoxy-L-arabinose transferase-like glycosyltransferase